MASEQRIAASPPLLRGGFDFTQNIRLVCADMIGRLSQLHHIDLDRVAITFSQARLSVSHGLQASLTPMRFENGREHGIRNGRRVGVQRLVDKNGMEMLYLLTFYLPRFMNQSFREKLVTILHELWHISPRFDGDLRRHPGRYYAHTHCEQEYDAEMAMLADRWLDQAPPTELLVFLKADFRVLSQKFGSIRGLTVPAPKLIPLD